MPSPWPLLVPCLVIAVIGSLVPWCIKVRNSWVKTHTTFLFAQIGEALQVPPAIETKAELIQRLKSAIIDWNSCHVTDGEITDSWKNPIKIEFSSEGRCFVMRSAGPDREFDTGDHLKSNLPVIRNP